MIHDYFACYVQALCGMFDARAAGVFTERDIQTQM